MSSKLRTRDQDTKTIGATQSSVNGIMTAWKTHARLGLRTRVVEAVPRGSRWRWRSSHSSRVARTR